MSLRGLALRTPWFFAKASPATRHGQSPAGPVHGSGADGVRHYGLPDPRPVGPTVPWNPNHGEVLSGKGARFNTSLKFQHVITAEIGVSFHWGLADPVIIAGPSAPLSVSQGDLSADY